MQKTIANIIRIWKILKPFHGYLTVLVLLLVANQGIATAFTVVNAKILTLLSNKDISHIATTLILLGLLYMIEYILMRLRTGYKLTKQKGRSNNSCKSILSREYLD